MQTCPSCGYSYLDRRAETKRDEFIKALVPFMDKYGKEMVREFFDYWSETNTNGKKMRFEMEKTWDLDRRLSRWSKNNFNKSTSKLEAIKQTVIPMKDRILSQYENE